MNEVLEERIHQEAWKIRREDITKRKLAMKREASDRQLAICKQQVNKLGKTKKYYEKLPKLKNKARVFIYRNDGENQKYPESRLFVNNIKKGNLSKNTFTVLYLEEGQYLLEEKIGFSNHIFGSVKSTPANITIQASKTYYVRLITSQNDDLIYKDVFLVPDLSGGIEQFLDGRTPQAYISGFVLQDQSLGECYMTGSKFVEIAQ